MKKAVLFKSEKRFSAFKEKLSTYGVDCEILDFAKEKWIEFDYGDIDFLIYFPSFKYTSNHPLALHEVHDNLMYIHSRYPKLRMFPDPKIIPFYNDKYRQFLFLKGNRFPIPRTIPLVSEDAVDVAGETLGYPLVVKNRYGASGGSVFRVSERKELVELFNISQMNFFNLESAKYFSRMVKERDFFYHLIKEKKASYPFLSPPLLAQEFVTIKRDLKTVVGNGEVVEAHWRYKANDAMWKVNIDAGGVGVWSKVDKEALDVSERLAQELDASWINLDLIEQDGNFLITEFSPVWHHYAYREKPSFVYKDDYNIKMPLQISLDLERIIIESLMEEKQVYREGSRGISGSEHNASTAVGSAV